MNFDVKRIDHLGIVAGMIKDLGVIEVVDDRLGRDKQEIISSGEVIAGMILNGLGFVSRPLMLTPQFFENKALEVLFRPGITPDHFNRHKIGRVMDVMAEYGNEQLFNSIAMVACQKEEVNMQFGHCDTTSFSLTGEYDRDSDTETIKVTHGYSKDFRNDLKQVVLELIVTQDGGVPLANKVWNGNASDTVILRKRVQKFLSEFKKSENRYFVADSKLYTSETASLLNQIYFITRIPSTLNSEHDVILQALNSPSSWVQAENGYKMQEFASNEFNIDNQRWIVVYSEQARERSEKTLKKEIAKEKERIKKELFHLQAQRFECEIDAKKQLKKIAKKWKFHTVAEETTKSIGKHTKPGRPAATDTPQRLEWQITAQSILNQEKYNSVLDQRSCFVIGTNIPAEHKTMQEVLEGYKGQDKAEKGFQFLKSNEFFAASFFLKKPERIESLVNIMVLSLLVYSLAQRRLRKQLEIEKETLPNQIKKPTATPTMRWIFQQFEGINFITVTIEDNVIRRVIDGFSEIRQKIVNLLGQNIQKIYQFSVAGG